MSDPTNKLRPALSRIQGVLHIHGKPTRGGFWDMEPDFLEFRASGFPCILVRSGLGAWCGYVGVPPGHPWHSKGYDDVEANVHGGLTYAEPCTGVVCREPQPGESDNVWWLGFDCAHSGDIVPGLTMFGARHSSLGESYRTMLSDDGSTATAIRSCLGKTVVSIRLDVTSDPHALRIAFADSVLSIFDSGQSCCETRYMACDDDLPSFSGGVLVEVDVRTAAQTSDSVPEWSEHDIQFLVVKTSKGDITVATHNEHNGYYGGFSINASLSSVTP